MVLCLQTGGILAATINYTDTEQYPLTASPLYMHNFLAGDGPSLIPADTTNNMVNVNYTSGSGVIHPVFVFGGLAENADAYNNIVNISNGFVDLDVIGGVAYNGNAYNNMVNVSDSVYIAQWVIGGRATDMVYGNTVNISGSPTIYNISGGRSNSGNVYDNTLVVNNYQGSVINGIYNFDNYQFIIGDNVSAIAAALKLTNAVNLANAAIGITGVMPNVALNPGDQLMLIDNATGAFDETYNTAKSGFGLIYKFDYDYSGSTLMATLVDKYANPQAEALSEGRMASMVFLNQKADMLNNQAFPYISYAFAANPQTSYMPFVLTGGGRSHYKSGSSINVEGFSTLAGLAYHPESTGLIVGVFFEGGWGDYNSRNSFRNSASIKGNGDTDYYGGGLMARYDDIFRSLYAQGSLSLGRAKTDFKSADYVNHAGQSASYDSTSAYYSANIGLGYLYQINQQALLDIYGRYLWNHLNSDSVNMYGERVKFKAADSHRTQLGLRLNYELFAGFTPYAGAAWDYEFGSRAKSSVSGASIDAPHVKGSTGIFDVGMTIQPDLDMPFYIKGGAQGYIGKREGVSGVLNLALSF